jgi:hypothetical protein
MLPNQIRWIPRFPAACAQTEGNGDNTPISVPATCIAMNPLLRARGGVHTLTSDPEHERYMGLETAAEVVR